MHSLKFTDSLMRDMEYGLAGRNFSSQLWGNIYTEREDNRHQLTLNIHLIQKLQWNSRASDHVTQICKTYVFANTLKEGNSMLHA